MFTILNRIKKDEGGQGMLFAALVLLVVVAFTLTVVDVGTVVHRKVQAQTAADAAAMSGATLMARGLNIITYLNFGIVACYILIGLTLLTWIISCIAAAFPITCIVGAPMCAFFNASGQPIMRGLQKLAKGVNNLQEAIAKTYGVLIGVEMLRVANKNLTNASSAGSFDDFEGSMTDLGDYAENGALGMSAVPMVPPMLSDCVEQGKLKDILKDMLPDALSDVAFGDDGNVSYTHEYTYPDTVDVWKIYCRSWVDHCACKFGHRNNDFIECIRSDTAPEDGCLTVKDKKIVDRKGRKGDDHNVGETGDPEEPYAMPYQLKEDWQPGTRIGALAFRTNKIQAISEKLFGDSLMIRRNYTFAEAEAYQDDREAGDRLLLEPTWQSRMVPVTMVDDLLGKFGNSSLLDSAVTRLLLH